MAYGPRFPLEIDLSGPRGGDVQVDGVADYRPNDELGQTHHTNTALKHKNGRPVSDSLITETFRFVEGPIL